MAKTRKVTRPTRKPLRRVELKSRPKPDARLDTGEGTDDGKIVNQPPIEVSKKGGRARQPRVTRASASRATKTRSKKPSPSTTTAEAAATHGEPNAPWKRDTRSIFNGPEHTKPADVRGVIRTVDGKRFTARQPGKG